MVHWKQAGLDNTIFLGAERNFASGTYAHSQSCVCASGAGNRHSLHPMIEFILKNDEVMAIKNALNRAQLTEFMI